MTSVVYGRWLCYVDMLARDASLFLVSKPAAVLVMHKARQQRREINIKSTSRGHMPDLMAPPHVVPNVVSVWAVLTKAPRKTS